MIVIRVCQFGQNWVSKKEVVFLCEIYMYRIKRKKFHEDPSTLSYIFLRAKKLGGPLGPKKIVTKCGFIISKMIG